MKLITFFQQLIDDFKDISICIGSQDILKEKKKFFVKYIRKVQRTCSVPRIGHFFNDILPYYNWTVFFAFRSN